MSKLTRNNSKKYIKLTKNKNNNNNKNNVMSKKSLIRDININKNLLVNNDSFKTYGIQQLEKWEKILNKEKLEQSEENNKLTKLKILPNKNLTKKYRKKTDKIKSRKNKKRFFNLFN